MVVEQVSKTRFLLRYVQTQKLNPGTRRDILKGYFKDVVLGHPSNDRG